MRIRLIYKVSNNNELNGFMTEDTQINETLAVQQIAIIDVNYNSKRHSTGV